MFPVLYDYEKNKVYYYNENIIINRFFKFYNDYEKTK